MTLLISIMLLLGSISAQARDYHVLDLDEAFLDYKNYSIISDKQRNLLLYPEFPKESLNFNVNTTLCKYGYFNSIIESLTTSSQYRGIGLQLSLGIHISEYLDVGYYHHSQHTIDREMESIPKFPTEDTLQIKIYFYRKSNAETVF